MVGCNKVGCFCSENDRDSTSGHHRVPREVGFFLCDAQSAIILWNPGGKALYVGLCVTTGNVQISSTVAMRSLGTQNATGSIASGVKVGFGIPQPSYTPEVIMKKDTAYIDSFTIVVIFVVILAALIFGSIFLMTTGMDKAENISPSISPTRTPVRPPVTSPTVTPAVIPTPTVKNLTVTFLDVGQGDSAWVSSPSGYTLLIDAGEEYKVVTANSGIKLDYVIATHPHSDHIGGMDSVLSSYDIGRFIDIGYSNSSSSIYEEMLTTIDRKDIPYTIVRSGDELPLDPLMQVKVLNPQVQFFPNTNDNSIVLLLVYRNISILFAGDTERNAESIYARPLPHVTVLKVAHHGSDSSTGPYLIAKTHPRVSIISVGSGNQYGHPSQDVITRLTKDGSVIYRTDLDGDITFTTDGEHYSVVLG